jgi:hypothetical protein
MSLGCALQRRTLDTLIVQEAIDDLDLEQLVRPWRESESERRQAKPALTVPSFAAAKPFYQKWPLYAVLAIAAGSVLAWPPSRAAELVRRHFLFRRSHAAPAGPKVAGQSKRLGNGAGVPGATKAQGGPAADPEIRVKPDEPLPSLSQLYGGRSDKRVLDDILELNLWLKDPERMPTGQILRMPVHPQVEGEMQPIPESSAVPSELPGQRKNR